MLTIWKSLALLNFPSQETISSEFNDGILRSFKGLLRRFSLTRFSLDFFLGKAIENFRISYFRNSHCAWGFPLNIGSNYVSLNENRLMFDNWQKEGNDHCKTEVEY